MLNPNNWKPTDYIVLIIAVMIFAVGIGYFGVQALIPTSGGCGRPCIPGPPTLRPTWDAPYPPVLSPTPSVNPTAILPSNTPTSQLIPTTTHTAQPTQTETPSITPTCIGGSDWCGVPTPTQIAP